MERRRWGSARPEVSVIGQGTWYIDRADRGSAIAALRRGLELGMTHSTRPRCTGRPSTWSPKPSPGVERTSFSYRRSFRKMRPDRALWSPANDRSVVSRPTGSIATFCIGLALTLWRRRSRPSSSCGARAKIISWGVSNFDVPDLNAAETIAGEGRLAAIRSCTIWRNVRSSIRSPLGVRRMGWPWLATARLVMTASLARARREAASCKRSPSPTAPLLARWRFAS